MGAAAVLLATAWQPLGLGRLLAGGGEDPGATVAPPDGPSPGTAPADTAPPPVPGTPRLMAGRGGNAQSGPVRTALPEPLRVQVLDSAGVPVPDVEVVFEIVAGEGVARTPRGRTDGEGTASTILDLPATPQEVEVKAHLPEAEGVETRFLVSAVPATGTAIGGIDGNDQTGLPGERLPDPILVRVVDDGGAPVEGAEVEFTTETGSVTPGMDVTDAEGWAVARWTLGDDEGEQEVVARLVGSGLRAVFNATAAAPPEDDEEEDSAAAVPVGAGPPVAVARRGWDVGGTMVCVIGAEGRPFCRGGTSASSDVSGVVAVASGVTHACGVDDAGRAFCWGANDGGQLGDGSRTPHDGRPVEGGLRFSRLVAGLSHTCGLDGEGRVSCWGRNVSGQLGTGGRDDRTVPIAVASPLRFAQLAAGWNHTCGLTGSGQVHCWGLNAAGQLGDGTRIDRLAPVPVAAGAGFSSLAAGSGHTCALRDGQVFCWGDNQHGQLGDGTVDTNVRPQLVPGLPPAVSVVAGAGHSCARTAAGEVFCWGQNLYGQLGDGTNLSRAVPTPVASELRFTSILAGGAITCGRSTDGGLWCWGFNQNGQLGDGSRSNRAVPTRVGG